MTVITDQSDQQTGAKNGSGFVLDYNWTEQDELDSLIAVTRELFQPSRQITRMVVVCAGVAATLFGLNMLSGDSPMLALLNPVVLLMGIAALLLGAYRVIKGKRAGDGRAQMEHLAKTRGGIPASLTGPMQATLSANGISLINQTHGRSSYQWSAISDLTVSDGYLMLHCLWIIHARLPLSAFESDEQRVACISACQSWIEQAVHAIPDGSPPSAP
ncbi:MAG: hypothetical protein Alpg2KO_19740 [Alphaproteobacteria bacterium]